MVHGFPRTSLMWGFLAPKLGENHTLICVDLRAYGCSGRLLRAICATDAPSANVSSTIGRFRSNSK
jgi:pimeloyl-ACP methyl ester carboxylesterase